MIWSRDNTYISYLHKIQTFGALRSRSIEKVKDNSKINKQKHHNFISYLEGLDFPLLPTF